MPSKEIDSAVERVQNAVDDVIDEAEELSDEARQEVSDGIENLVQRLKSGDQ